MLDIEVVFFARRIGNNDDSDKILFFVFLYILFRNKDAISKKYNDIKLKLFKSKSNTKPNN